MTSLIIPNKLPINKSKNCKLRNKNCKKNFRFAKNINPEFSMHLTIPFCFNLMQFEKMSWIHYSTIYKITIYYTYFCVIYYMPD